MPLTPPLLLARTPTMAGTLGIKIKLPAKLLPSKTRPTHGPNIVYVLGESAPNAKIRLPQNHVLTCFATKPRTLASKRNILSMTLRYTGYLQRFFCLLVSGLFAQDTTSTAALSFQLLRGHGPRRPPVRAFSRAASSRACAYAAIFCLAWAVKAPLGFLVNTCDWVYPWHRLPAGWSRHRLLPSATLLMPRTWPNGKNCRHWLLHIPWNGQTNILAEIVRAVHIAKNVM